MERIKQAVEKARGERDLAGGSQGTVPQSVTPEPGHGVIGPRIQYSQTRVTALDDAVLRRNHVITGAESSEGLAAYKMLRTQVLQRMVANGWNALAVTSPCAGDGKTLTAINLAISLARELHHTVLLVDLDLRNPSVHKTLGVQPMRGVDDYLLRGAQLTEVMVNPGIERLVLLPARTTVDNSSEILASPIMGEFVQELKARYPSRMVLFDLPPILSSDDTLSFAPHIDALLLVAREGKTHREELDQAFHVLNNVTVLGTVLNASAEKGTTYY